MKNLSGLLGRLANEDDGIVAVEYALVVAVTRALEKHIGKPLDPRDLISTDGCYPTPSACELAGCKGCLPSEAYDEHERIKPQFQHLKPGAWTVASAARLTSAQQKADA